MHGERNKNAGPLYARRVRQSSPYPGSEWIVEAFGLHTREQQVVQGILDELDERAIARRMRLSVNTVRTYRKSLYRKIGVHCRCSLVLRIFAVQEG